MNVPDFNQLDKTLTKSLDLAISFSQLLATEKQQLTSNNPDTVTMLLEQKEQLIAELTSCQQWLLDFCDKADIEPSHSALRSLLYRLQISSAEAILEKWSALKNALIKNQAHNKTNEIILAELIRRNQIKQHILCSLNQSEGTYSAKGQRQTSAAQGWVEQV